MVKVVGKDPSAVYRTTCYNCAALLEYTRGETVEKKCNYDYMGDCDIRPHITCPSCNKEIQVSFKR